MDIKKLLIGGVVGGILYFGLGYLIYGHLLADFMAKHPGTVLVNRRMEDIKFLYLGAGNLAWGGLIAFILLRSNARTAASGFFIGGVVGLLSTGGTDLIMHATTNAVSRMMTAADTVAYAVMSAIVGAVVAIVMSMMDKKAA